MLLNRGTERRLVNLLLYKGQWNPYIGGYRNGDFHLELGSYVDGRFDRNLMVCIVGDERVHFRFINSLRLKWKYKQLEKQYQRKMEKITSEKVQNSIDKWFGIV